MPSHVSHAENFLEAAHCVSQTGRMLLPSEYISGCWGCRWCSRCSQHQHRVPVGCQKSQHIELRISTGQNRLSSLILLHFEREILWTKPFIVINTFASKHGRSNYFLSITFLWPLVLPSSQRTIADQCQEVEQLVGTVRCCLYFIVMDIIRNIYHLITNSLLYFMEHTNLIIDIIKNAPDLILPLPSLGYIETAQQFMAFCRVIFSEADVCQVLNPKLWREQLQHLQTIYFSFLFPSRPNFFAMGHDWSIMISDDCLHW